MNSSTLSLFNVLSGDALSSVSDTAGSLSSDSGQTLFSLPIMTDDHSQAWQFGKGSAPLVDTGLELQDEDALSLINWAGMMLPLGALPNAEAAPPAASLPAEMVNALPGKASAAPAMTATTLGLQLSASSLLRADVQLQGADDLPSASSAPSLGPASGPALFSSAAPAASLLGQPTAAPPSALLSGSAGAFGALTGAVQPGKLVAEESVSVAKLSTLLANGDGSSAVQQLEQQLQMQAAPERRLDLSSTAQTERPQQLADAVWAQINWMSDKSIGRASIELHPEDLGQIEIELQLDGKSARVEFIAASAETRHLLETTVPRLRELFAQQNINLADAGISDGKSQAGSDQPRREAMAQHGIDPGSTVDSTEQVSVKQRLHLGGLSEYA